MSNWGFIVVGWGAVGGLIALYAARLVARGRSLSRRVPDARRRWMQ